MTSNPFRVFEEGEPGNQRAVAEFSCPKCAEISRFTADSEDSNGGFVCPHCELLVEIRGTRLSDYQGQLDAIDAQLGGFARELEGRLRQAAKEIAVDPADADRDEVH